MERSKDTYQHGILNQGDENEMAPASPSNAKSHTFSGIDKTPGCKFVLLECEMETFGYKAQSIRRMVCVFGYIISCGFLWLIFYWKPEWHVWAHCIPCSLQEADTILLKTTDEFEQYCRKNVIWIQPQNLNISKTTTTVTPVIADSKSIISKSIQKPDLKVKMIRVQKISYVWDQEEQKFERAGVLEDSLSCYDIHSKFAYGLTTEEQNIRRSICGLNKIEVDVVPIWKLLLKEVLNPFYAFEACSLALWFAVGFIEYSIAVIIMTLISIIFTVHDLRKNGAQLHNLVESNNSVKVTVRHKNGECKEIESQCLVPGDVLVLTGKKLFLPCDTILITGGCIVNESMLTGESVPVCKIPLPHLDRTLPWKEHSGEDFKRHILFCGTEVIQTKSAGHGHVKAVVLRTGFNTAKGDMVRSILYPKPMNFKLYRDAFRFLMILATVAVIGTIYTVAVFVMNGIQFDSSDVVIKALIIITTAVPPALSAALSTGIMYAQRRLKTQGIFCISPQRINVCGRLNLICFDKTGTLTEDGLDLWGLLPASEKSFQKILNFTSGNTLPWGPLLGAMSSCHSLVNIDGTLQGDPLDVKMFEGTHWYLEGIASARNWRVAGREEHILHGPPPAGLLGEVPVEGIAIVHQFPFSSSLQRMSVVTHAIGDDKLVVYMKGAPEMVTTFCKSESVPKGFTSELQFYTTKGFRVIGLAYKTLEGYKISGESNFLREDVESNLEFLGLLILENRLKPETKPVLQELSSANIRTVMITGDNLQTAITVAKTSGLVPENSKVILVDADEPDGLNPAKISWHPVEGHEECSDDDKTKKILLNQNNATEGILTSLEGQQEGVIMERTAFTTAQVGEVKSPNLTTQENQTLNIEIERRTIEEEAKGGYHFAMSGKSYQAILQHFPCLLPKLMVNGAIFARMSPGQKSSLVEEFQKLDYYVCMCGDGANDCGALKVAHAGISLSEQEASVASPFTSRTPNIRCVPQLIKEGRAALVTSFCVFKYMTLYAMIQFICLLLLYWQINILSNYQLLVQDVAVTILVCLTMSLNHAYPKLAPYRPPAQLMSPPLLLSVVLHSVLTLAIQVYGFLLVQQQSWYSTYPPRNTAALETNLCFTLEKPSVSSNTCELEQLKEKTNNIQYVHICHESYETTTLWYLTTIHCIIVAFVFSKGKPFRQPIYTNYIFTFVLVAQLGVSIFLLFADIENIYNVMELVCTSTSWRITIFIMLIITVILSILAEELIIENRKLWLLLKKCFKYKSKSQYRKTIRLVEADTNWPPINRTYRTKPVSRHTNEKTEVYINPTFENEEFLK
ncbi:probable cation-transporting ATPase 13A4 [Pelobates cultripes]|uniref:Cation-transporting ATPase n=1 Tax=Pelobates cultripes TaxID=61616 RepID=A0AAD1RCB8_PELCU|nr:probable cation-transporting ATPase 13A4 [Pelobates cultripes]